MDTVYMMNGISWEVYLIGGLISIIFGAVFFFLPELVLGLLVLLVGLFFIVVGIASIVKGASMKVRSSSSALYLIGGILETLIGLTAFIAPDFVAAVLVYIIAFWAAILGLGELVVAVVTPELGWGRLIFLFGGIISLLLALIMVLSPLAAGVVLIQIIGIFALVWGIVNVVQGMVVRGHQETGYRKVSGGI